MSKTVYEKILAAERRREQGPWIPASGGTERPFLTRTGKRLQYLWQPSTGKHAYLDVDNDIILTDEEAMHALGHYDPPIRQTATRRSR